MPTAHCFSHTKSHFLDDERTQLLVCGAAHCLRPSRQRAYQMTDPHNKKSSSSGPGQQHSELISMYDSHTWPETRRSETFHSQASKLWEFVTEELVSYSLTRLGTLPVRPVSAVHLTGRSQRICLHLAQTFILNSAAAAAAAADDDDSYQKQQLTVLPMS